jgi:hypothetical protein
MCNTQHWKMRMMRLIPSFDTICVHKDLNKANTVRKSNKITCNKPFTINSDTNMLRIWLNSQQIMIIWTKRTYWWPLFSHFSSSNSAYDCLSTTIGLTNFIEAMSSDHPDPYRLDTPFVPQPTDGTLDPIHHVPFLQHYSDLDTRTNPMLPSYITLMQLYRTI